MRQRNAPVPYSTGALGYPDPIQEREILRARRKEEMPNPAKTSAKNTVVTTRINSPGTSAGGASA